MIDREMGIPLRNESDDRDMMLYYMHIQGIISYSKLLASGIRTITLRKYHKQERTKYLFHAIPLSHKPKHKVRVLPKHLKARLEYNLVMLRDGTVWRSVDPVMPAPQHSHT